MDVRYVLSQPLRSEVASSSGLVLLGGSWDLVSTYIAGRIAKATIGVTYIMPVRETKRRGISPVRSY